jgi:hypothetical protein
VSLIRPLRGKEGFGVEFTTGGRVLQVVTPLRVRLADQREVRAGYAEAAAEGSRVVATGFAEVRPGCVLRVHDTWVVDERGAVLDREVTVDGDGDGGFVTAVTVPVSGLALAQAEPFLPGVIYGGARPVPALSLGSPSARAAGLRELTVREDRAAAPVFTLREPDGSWIAVAHLDPRGGTVAADGADIEGAPLVDARLDYGSLGATDGAHGAEAGFWFPGTEGEYTYESGGLPLRQLHRPRERFHPLNDGLQQRYRVEFRAGRSASVFELHESVSAWMWETLHPTVERVSVDAYLDVTIDVLAGQVQDRSTVTGIALESDPTVGRPLPESTAAVMGFVGANTDAAACLLRAAREGIGTDPDRLRYLGTRILDSFAALPADATGGEGFDLATGQVITYRELDDQPAVFLRALAEGWSAALRGFQIEESRGAHHAAWRDWAVRGAEWMLTQQRADGHIPRAWDLRAQVLEGSTNSSVLAVKFLLEVASHSGQAKFRDAALAAGEASWADAVRRGGFAGATLDNPDVVDKEASVMALEAYLAIHIATGDDVWLARARAAAIIAETWVHLWDIPMAVDGDDESAHWKRGRPTTGMQLITTGVTMSDGFLQVNAAAFALLGDLTGEQHWTDVARLVHHGSKSMLGLPGRTFDLAGPGWQQEHWGFATNRGRGLNRSWLPWTAVATIDGVFRLRDLPRGIGDRILH